MQPAIIHQNENYLILNKPAGWYTIPAREPKDSDPVVSAWIKKTLEIEPWVVHRLDRFTSGILLFAKTKETHREANRWFEKREVKKIYHFFAFARHDSSIISKPAVQIKTPVDGKPSQSLFEIISKIKQTPQGLFFYGKATPLTGRFHQIREHAREGGFALLGDKAYGFDAKLAGIDFHRVALHAYELTLPYGKFQAPMPEDMASLIP